MAAKSDVEQFMETASQSGITVILKVDHERMIESGDPWTLVMSGPGLGEAGFVRAEAPTLTACIEEGYAHLERILCRERD